MKYSFSLLLIICSFSVFAQSKAKPKPAATPVKKSVPAPAVVNPALKNLSDSASYALGVNIASSLNREMKGINTDLMIAGLKDVFSKRKTLITTEASYEILDKYARKLQESGNDEEIKKSNDFLTANKQKPGIKTTASGLQYEVLQEGNGPKPQLNDTVICHYRGTLIDGTEFDASYNRNEPLTIPVKGVIKGWTEGLQLMSKGSKYKFYIPYDLAYGLRGAPPAIPGGAALIFEIELLDIKKGN